MSALTFKLQDQIVLRAAVQGTVVPKKMLSLLMLHSYKTMLALITLSWNCWPEI